MAYYRYRIMNEPPLPEEELEKENKFAGESFGTDNVRTVYAGSSQDTKERESRIIILVGPSGTGKSTLIDCMCNYFYGAKLEESIRYKIADEQFDNTTPRKSIIKYVFNGTEMPYRPIVIDTPGIGDPSGVKADDELKGMISNWLAFDPRSHIHAVGLVLPSAMTRLTPKIEAELEHTLSLFPKWMHGNVVPMVTKCDGSPEPSVVILRHFGLHNNPRFRFNTSALYQKKSENYLNEQLRRMYWDLSMSNMDDFFDHVGQLHPQCIEEQLNPLHIERPVETRPIPPAPTTKPPSPPHPPPPPPTKPPQSVKPFEVPTTIAEEPPRTEEVPAFDLPQIVRESTSVEESEVPEEPTEEFVSIKRYTYDPSTLSHNVHLISEKRSFRTGSEPTSKRSSVVVTKNHNHRSSLHENGAELGFHAEVHRKLEKANEVRETNLDADIQEKNKERTPSSTESSPTDAFRKNMQFSLRSTASDWQYTPSNTEKRYRPGSGIRRSVDRENLTPLRRENPPEEPPLQPLTPNGGPQPAPRDSLRRNGTPKYENTPEATVPPPVPKHSNDQQVLRAPIVKDTDIDADLESDNAGFQRNELTRTSFHSSSLKNGRSASNRPDSSNYGDDWGTEPAPTPPTVPADYENSPSGNTEWDAVGYKPNPRLEPPRSLVVASRPYYFADRREPQNEKGLLRDVEAIPTKYQYSQPLLATDVKRRPENPLQKQKNEILNCCFFLLAPIMVIFIFAAIMLTLILAH